MTGAVLTLALAAAPVRAQGKPPWGHSAWDGSTWLVEDIRGRGVIDNAQTTLNLEPDGKVSGSTGCNRFVGRATIAGEQIRFGKIGVTMRACPPALVDQERKFLSALGEAHGLRRDRLGRLQIISADGEALLTLTKL